MIRWITIGISSVSLFFLTFIALSFVIDVNYAAGIAAFMMYIGFPMIMLKLWKTYPPLDVVAVDIDDPVMQKCIAKAQSTLPHFIKELKLGEKEAFIKYPISTENENTEHIWGLAHSFDNNEVIVSQVNDTVDNLSEEQTLRQKVAIDNIEDWMLIDVNETCEGGYTHLALYEAYRSEYGKFPKKYLPYLETFKDIDFEKGVLN